MLYSIKEIAEKCGKTTQSIQKLRAKNSEFLNQHTHKNGRFVNYDETALEWFLNYYSVQTVKGEEKNGLESPTESANSQRRIAELELKIADLQNQLSEKEKQLGIALLALSREQETVMKLLPAPKEKKKTIGQRIKAIFSKEKGKA